MALACALNVHSRCSLLTPCSGACATGAAPDAPPQERTHASRRVLQAARHPTGHHPSDPVQAAAPLAERLALASAIGRGAEGEWSTPQGSPEGSEQESNA